MKIDEKNVFVLDGLGAVLSIILLALVLPALEPWLGMPVDVLRWLVAWPIVCLLYDASCSNFADLEKPTWLLGIITLNTSYCVATVILMGVHLEVLSAWGVAYFVAEIPVILGLVVFELKVWRRAFRLGTG